MSIKNTHYLNRYILVLGVNVTKIGSNFQMPNFSDDYFFVFMFD